MVQRRAPFLPLLLVCILSSHTTSGFNLLDVAVPTVTSSGLPNGADIAFGFTLAQHTFSNGEKVTLVSAPKDNGKVEREGGIYRCPFENNAKCQNVTAFQTRNNINQDEFGFGSFLSVDNESYIGQLMGYSLRSFTNHVVACAPLYSSVMISRRNNNDYNTGIAQGRCAILNKDLSNSVLQIVQDDVTGQQKLHLAGLDTGLVDTGSVETLAISDYDQMRNPTGELFVIPLDFSQFSSQFFIPSPVVVGYHMETGNFVSLSRKQVAVSAPKDRTHIGSIHILNTETRVTSAIVRGDPEEPDGYFGYDFAAVNFSTGGYHSLVVGCPLCNRDRGRVYVYVHTGDTSNPFGGFASLDSPSSVTGRFGMAVEDTGDIDLDGFSDVAISAPYINNGVVYIFRGSASGLVTDTYQEIPALPNGANTFGYSLSGGLDIDENGYPDLTIGDLSGSQVTSLRAVPLVNVTLDFPNPQTMVDLASNQRCQIQSSSLICFTVRPCFSYTPIHGNVPQFKLKYTLVLDEQEARVGLMEQDGQFGSNMVVRNITIPEPDRQQCEEFTLALRADFIQTVPILVQLSVDDADQPLALEEDQSSRRLGGPLHPVLSRYIQGGEKRATLSTSYSVSFNLNCTGGATNDTCEPAYRIQTFPTHPSSENVTISPAGLFGFNITVTNTANDDGLSPLLKVHLPNGTLFNSYNAISQDALTSCQRGATVECQLRNPTPGKGELQLQLNFNFNVSAIDLDTTELLFQFEVIDGFSRTVSAYHTETIMVNTTANYTVRIDVSEDEYQATKSPPDPSTLPLNSTGPQIPFSIIVQNNLSNTNGTPVPRTTLIIHLPTDIILSNSTEPLLIPTNLVFEENINCSHYEAISNQLSPIQQPSDFLLPWMGERPPQNPQCEENGKFKCGFILCTVTNLEPSDRPLQLTVFTRLFSPSFQLNTLNVTVYATLLSTDVAGYTELQGDAILPTAHRQSMNSSEATFLVVSAVRERNRPCIAYWIVAVSVVGGILALLVIVVVLGMCGLFGTWYKAKMDEKAANDSDQPDDGEFLFHTRTIPPIPGIIPEPGYPELTAFQTTAAAEKEREVAQLEKEAREEMKKKAVVDVEAETDRYVYFPQQEQASSAPLDRTSPLRLEDLTFDPHKGVDEDYEGPETEI